MKVKGYFKWTVLFVLMAAGCSSLPGLAVLSGQDPQDNVSAAVIENVSLVMADKTGATDPSLIAAADRIEAASSDLDIIEIRNDEGLDIFEVNMLLRPPGPNMTAQDYNNIIRRAVELTWQGTLRESDGADLLRINIIDPQTIPTLDHGPSFIGRVAFNFEIARTDAIAYLSGSHSINDFIDMIAQGTLALDQPTEFIVYEGQPNHPMFMLPQGVPN